jgi:hypothetical protein
MATTPSGDSYWMTRNRGPGLEVSVRTILVTIAMHGSSQLHRRCRDELLERCNDKG